VLRDITDGAQSLGELDFAAMCRRHGVPAPDRQVLRRTARGRVYLDARWDGRRLVVEVDGSGHRVGLAVTDDNLRQNEVSLDRNLVLRIDLVGLRVHESAFMGQVCRGLLDGERG
jgi:very-short-patch-repair endonuclease